jgi:hypothetical protein
VTILRLVGELREGPPWLFSRLPGGGLAVVGIAWLVPIFGVWFGYRLTRLGHPPPSGTQAVVMPLAAAFAFFLIGGGTERLGLAPTGTVLIAAYAFGAFVAVLLALGGWPELSRVLLAYALAARIPVAMIMLVAILRRWGTHYDAPPPVFPPVSPFRQWLWTGLLPQLTVWVAYTVVVGGLFGVFGRILASRRTA